MDFNMDTRSTVTFCSYLIISNFLYSNEIVRSFEEDEDTSNIIR